MFRSYEKTFSLTPEVTHLAYAAKIVVTFAVFIADGLGDEVAMKLYPFPCVREVHAKL